MSCASHYTFFVPIRIRRAVYRVNIEACYFRLVGCGFGSEFENRYSAFGIPVYCSNIYFVLLTQVCAEDSSNAIYLPTSARPARVVRVCGEGEVGFVCWAVICWEFGVYGVSDGILSFRVFRGDLDFLQEENGRPGVAL
jgi:hypothetical protein